jgi:CubicO group peptidase (beta-lactamase class C family)
LLLRYLFGFEASALITGAIGSNAQRTETAAITDFIKTRLPETQNDAPAVLQPAWDFAPALAEQVGTNQAAVNGVIDHVFTDTAVQAVLVTKDGYLIGERYSQGYDADSLGTSWSVAKSFYSAAIGVAIDEGHITSVDQKASDIITEWQGTAKANVTLHQMLQMRSGYSAFDNVFFETDQTAYAIDRPLVRAPGSQFAYSNANSQLFETILRRTTGLSAHDYLSQKILAPIDIDLKAVGLWFDPSGFNPLTYCCIDMKAADFARFGLLYARDGQWRGNQILPAAYVASSLTANGWYGYQWWILNAAYFSGEPAAIEVASAQGLNGQYIFVWPEEDVVIVVLSQYSHAVEQGYVVSAILFA